MFAFTFPSSSTMSIRKLSQLLAFCLGALLWLWQPLAHAQTAKEAGHIITAGSGVTALSKNGVTRKLERRSKVFEGDTIITTSSAAQIRFTDGSLTSLRPGTSFKVEAFNWNGAEDGSEKSFFSLIKGGLRTITGAIGKKNKDNYKMKTPVATIGIRGTVYELLIKFNRTTGQKKVIGVVIQGAIVLFKPGVSTYVGAAGESNFRVTVNADGTTEVETSNTPFEAPETDAAGGGGTNDGNDGGGNDGGDNGGNDDTSTTPDQDSVTEVITETPTSSRTTVTRVHGSAMDKCTNASVGCGGEAYGELEAGGGSLDVPGSGTETVTLNTVDGVDNVVTNIKDTDPSDPWELKTGNDVSGGADELEDFGSYDNGNDISWNWGRWGNGNWEEDCDDCDPVGSFVFIVGRGVTTSSELDALSGTASFGGSSVSGIAVDHEDKKLTINQLGFNADFSNRTISGFYLDIGKDGDESAFRSGFLQQYDEDAKAFGGTVTFAEALGNGDDNGIQLRSAAMDMEGEATAEFLGSSAGQAIGAFGVVNTSKDEGAVGVYAIEKD